MARFKLTSLTTALRNNRYLYNSTHLGEDKGVTPSKSHTYQGVYDYGS